MIIIRTFSHFSNAFVELSGLSYVLRICLVSGGPRFKFRQGRVSYGGSPPVLGREQLGEESERIVEFLEPGW